uniref:Ig-like domain-containing protein n=1 Tax=Ciona intestinalis TaxID=7719 RepID=F6X9K9_CIOIN
MNGQSQALLVGTIFWILLSVETRGLISVSVGATALLPCPSSRNDQDLPHVIEWLRQDRPVPVFIKIGKYPPHVNPHFKGRMSLLSNTATLRIQKVKLEDEGWYECRAYYFKHAVESSNGTLVHPSNGTLTKLYVTAPPAFKSTPPPSTVARVRESLLLQCRVVGKPPPDVTWRKDGWLLQNGENGIKINGGKLLVRSLTTSHRGNYECQGRNPQGQVEHTTSVFVQAPPEITVSPKDLDAKEEQDAFFYCKAEGYPADISYSWFFNGLEVGSCPQLRGRFRTFNDGTFEIESVSKEDTGNISCEAANDFGIAPRVTARLVVQC